MKRHSYPWYREYRVLGIPESLEPYPTQPVHHILYEAARKYANMGLVQKSRMMTYPELKDCADRLATAFVRMGLRKGDRVATLLPTCIPFEIASYAISRAGCVHLPGNHLEPNEVLQHKYTEGGARVLVYLDDFSGQVRSILANISFEHVIVTGLDPRYGEKARDSGWTEPEGTQRLEDLLRETPPRPPAIPFDVEEDLALLLFTGGTTGMPKGCMITHRNVYANALQNIHGFGRAHRLGRGSFSVLLGLPFSHAYGHCVMHSMTLLGFTQLLAPDPRDTGTMTEMMKTHRPLLHFGVPTQFIKLSQQQRRLAGVVGVSGSAPLARRVQDNFERSSDGGIMEGYGLSEMSPTTHLNPSLLIRLLGGRLRTRAMGALSGFPANERIINFALRSLGSQWAGNGLSRIVALDTWWNKSRREKGPTRKERGEKRGTIGIPLPDTKVKLLDQETGRTLTWKEVVAGAPGVMYVTGPQRMRGYWPRAGSGITRDGFVATGDIARMDRDGYFSIVDRTKDMIIVSGFKVYTRQIEEILQDHRGVEAVAVLGHPDPEREGSEQVAVFVQPVAGFRNRLKEQDIVDFLKPKVAKYAVPKIVRIVDALPLTGPLKVDKKELRKRLRGES